MRTIQTLAGTAIELDGDALQVIETIYRDLTTRHGLAYSFEDVDREIRHVIDQMQEADLRVYLKEILFMSFNRYENDRLLAIVQRASQASSDRPPARSRAKTHGNRTMRKKQTSSTRGRSRKLAADVRKDRRRR